MALREYRPEQKFLFWSPPQDVLPRDHLCFIVDELVEALDFSLLPDRSKTPGSPAYDPRLLVKAEVGELPERLLADSGYYTKKNLEYLKREVRGVKNVRC